MTNKIRKFRKRLISLIIFLQIAFVIGSQPMGKTLFNYLTDQDGSTPFNSNFFAGFTENQEDILLGDTLFDSLFDSNECLVSQKEAKKIIKEKYGLTEDKDIDENVRFILGKCNPVLFVPGIYATRLVVTINCKKFKNEDFNQFIHARAFCGESICKDENNEHEEHVLFPALFDSPFTLRETTDNKYSACLGYFLKFFNTKDECPKMENGDSTCKYSDAVRITYYGGTSDTLASSQCGLKAVKNVVSVGHTLIPESLVNSGSGQVYKEMINKFHSMGYREGFSYGAVPNDYRRFVATNTFMKETFRYQVNSLFENTGKPVIILAHSFGSLNVLHQLVAGDEKFLKKIKKFVAISPPFAGASKLLDVFLYGSHDFDTKISIIGFDILKVKYDSFGQSIGYNSLPTLAELRPLPILSELFKKKEYFNFSQAIKNIFDVEKICSTKICSDIEIKSLTKYFDKLFGEVLPSYTDKECKLNDAYSNSCRSEAFDNINCPVVVLKNSTVFDIKASDIEKYCGVYNSSILYDNTCENKYNNFLSFNSFPICVDSLYNSPPYPYNKDTIDEFINTFNSKYSKKYKITLNRAFFEDEKTFKKKMNLLIEHHNKISKTSSLPIPPIDTTIIYSNFVPTPSSFAYDQGVNKEEFGNDEILYKGGDGTVPNWSSYFTGLKWLYDKKTQNLPQNITLVEYCSPLSKPGGKYAYSQNTDKAFFGLGCDCINTDYTYNSKKLSNGECQHSTILSDDVLIKYLQNDVLVSSENLDKVTQDKKAALSKYNIKKNYEKVCSEEIKKIAESEWIS